ncbi:MAG: phosphoribosylformylglycinamidine cyclo-ligase [Bacteroidetes bacterium]|nr:phosphoribosylformylglycinamidine cyclo-ligase [Bacteroidota bacterium]
MSRYSQRGVSAQKEEVHQAVKQLDPGLFPHAFCKVYPDLLYGDPGWVNLSHADGAGTKSILAYLYWKETGDLSVWEGIAQDAIVMNLDDLLCVGITDQFIFSSTIDRNKHRIPGEVISALIEGSRSFLARMEDQGIRIAYLGGETADVGDLVRTVGVNGTLTARWPANRIITNEKIQAGDVIVGLASYGQAKYEHQYNSGIGSNGLTSARHDLLSSYYAQNHPESFEPTMDASVVYTGPYRLTDAMPGRYKMNIGQHLLSPTRTFAPVLKAMLDTYFDQIHGLIHCSGGGQSKCLKYLPRPLGIIKDNLFAPPPIFELIQSVSGADDSEMYQVFNMGTRLEIYLELSMADTLINLARSFGIDAQIIGHVVNAEASYVRIESAGKSPLQYPR